MIVPCLNRIVVVRLVAVAFLIASGIFILRFNRKETKIYQKAASDFCGKFYHPYDFDCNHVVSDADVAFISNHWHHGLADGYHDNIDAEMDIWGAGRTPDGIIDIIDIQKVSLHIGEWGPRIIQRLYGSYMNEELRSDWGHNWASTTNPIGKRSAFFIAPASSQWNDPWSEVMFNGTEWTGEASTLDSVYNQARTFPFASWILGEEPNYWHAACPNSLFGGKVCRKSDGTPAYPRADIYAHWYKDFTSSILSGWGDSGNPEHGSILGFYLLGDDRNPTCCGSPTGGYQMIENYLDDFYTEWTNNQRWGTVPIDALVITYRPHASKYYAPKMSGGEIDLTADFFCGPNWAIACGDHRSTDGITTPHKKMKDRPWLMDKWLIIETNHRNKQSDYESCRSNPACTEIQKDADIYCDVSNRVVNLIQWAKNSEGIDGLMWYEAFDTSNWAEISSLYCTRENGSNDVVCNSLMGTKKSNPTPGKLTYVGEAFRDGILPQECQ